MRGALGLLSLVPRTPPLSFLMGLWPFLQLVDEDSDDCSGLRNGSGVTKTSCWSGCPQAPDLSLCNFLVIEIGYYPCWLSVFLALGNTVLRILGGRFMVDTRYSHHASLSPAKRVGSGPGSGCFKSPLSTPLSGSPISDNIFYCEIQPSVHGYH